MFHASFQTATQLFYSMQYEQGLRLINECISNDPKNSILYSNRALFYSQLGLIQPALQDLNLALQLNYLNYIAYFNMFSLLMRCQQVPRAFQNLCCSLSCLYLIRAKSSKSEIDASKAIKYAENNIQAHVLKGLIHLQNGKYKLALNELDWAYEINPLNQIVRNIRNLIFRKMNPGLGQGQGEIQNQQQQNERNQKFLLRRLQCSYSLEQADQDKQLKDRIIEFNQLYSNLNQDQGTITTKVPKENQQNQVPLQNLYSSKIQNYGGQVNVLLEEGRQKQSYNEKVDEKYKSNEEELELKYNKETTDKQLNQLSLHQSSQNDQLQIRDLLKTEILKQKQTLNHEMRQRQNREEIVVDGQQVLDQDKINALIGRESYTRDHHERPNQVIQYSDAIVADYGANTPSKASLAPQPGEYACMSQNNELFNCQIFNIETKQFQIHHFYDKTQQHQEDQQSTSNNVLQQFQSMIHSNIQQPQQQQQSFDSFTQQKDNNQVSIISNSLYPKPDNAMLQFSILKLQILHNTQQQIQAMQNLYCIANYLNVKEGQTNSTFKLRTACKKGFNSGTEWNETFDPIQIPSRPECMKIKVYNKKYSSYRDDLIGEMEVQITTFGLVKLPLFNKKGQLSGTILMNLELIISPIRDFEEKEQF